MVVQVKIDAVDAAAAFRAVRMAAEVEQVPRAAATHGEGFDRYFVALVMIAQAAWVGALAYLVLIAV